MNLTYLLQNNIEEFKPFKEFLKKYIQKPSINQNRNILSPPLSFNYLLMGKAYDYLLRLTIAKDYNIKIHDTAWIAEKGFALFRPNQAYAKKIEDINSEQYIENFYPFVTEKFEQCKELIIKYINGRIAYQNKSLLEAIIFLTRLDDVYREGIHKRVEIFEIATDDEIDELLNLISNTSITNFKPFVKAILNPSFGNNSNTALLKADADLIVDDLLIDIKVTKKLVLDKYYFNQIVCYYLLYLHSGILDHPEVKIKRLGVYFARHDFLWSVNVEDLAFENIFNAAKNLMVQCISKYKQN